MSDTGEHMSARDAAIMALLRESAETAADRIIAHEERKNSTPSHVLTVGHIYAMIFCSAFLLVVIVGAMSQR